MHPLSTVTTGTLVSPTLPLVTTELVNVWEVTLGRYMTRGDRVVQQDNCEKCVARELFVVIGAVNSWGVTVIRIVISCKNGNTFNGTAWTGYDTQFSAQVFRFTWEKSNGGRANAVSLSAKPTTGMLKLVPAAPVCCWNKSVGSCWIEINLFDKYSFGVNWQRNTHGKLDVQKRIHLDRHQRRSVYFGYCSQLVSRCVPSLSLFGIQLRGLLR